MNQVSRPTDVVVFLSAPPDIARRELAAIRAEHPDDRLTVYLREIHRHHYEDLLATCFTYSDKPAGSKQAFLRELRSHLYDQAIVLDFGQWDFYPARCLFFLARAQRKQVRTERGTFPFTIWQPRALLSHLLHRAKHRSGSVANMPPRAPLPFVLAFYRKTIGLGIGIGWMVVEYGWRRLRR